MALNADQEDEARREQEKMQKDAKRKRQSQEKKYGGRAGHAAAQAQALPQGETDAAAAARWQGGSPMLDQRAAQSWPHGSSIKAPAASPRTQPKAKASAEGDVNGDIRSFFGSGGGGAPKKKAKAPPAVAATAVGLDRQDEAEPVVVGERTLDERLC